MDESDLSGVPIVGESGWPRVLDASCTGGVGIWTFVSTMGVLRMQVSRFGFSIGVDKTRKKTITRTFAHVEFASQFNYLQERMEPKR